jgi:hypothetical protein
VILIFRVETSAIAFVVETRYIVSLYFSRSLIVGREVTQGLSVAPDAHRSQIRTCPVCLDASNLTPPG